MTRSSVWRLPPRPKRRPSRPPAAPPRARPMASKGCRQPLGPPCPGCCEARQAFRKDAAWARGVITKELPDAELPPAGVTPPGQIGECAHIVAVHTLDHMRADRTGRHG